MSYLQKNFDYYAKNGFYASSDHIKGYAQNFNNPYTGFDYVYDDGTRTGIYKFELRDLFYIHITNSTTLKFLPNPSHLYGSNSHIQKNNSADITA